MDVHQAIKIRRSVRDYKAESLPEEKLKKVLEAARLAPSAHNEQEWKFVVVRDAEKRNQLSEAAGQSFLAEAPAIIVVVATDPEHVLSSGVPAYAVDLAIAVDHMTLQATEEGLGTCLEGSAELIFDDGTIERIDNFVEKRIRLKNENLEIGISKGSKILSWESFSPTFVNTFAVEKLPKEKKILKIKTQSGGNLAITPDHKIIIDTIDGPKLVRADGIKIGDYVYSPRKIDINNNELSILDFLLENKFFVHFDKKSIKKIKNQLRDSFGNLKKASEKLKISYDRIRYVNFTISNLKKICAELKIKFEDLFLEIKGLASQGSFYKLKSVFLTSDLMYLLGLISAEGSVDEKDNFRICFSNSEKGMIKIFCEKYKKIFPGMSTQIIKRENQNFLVRVNNFLLTKLCKNLQIKEDPKIIFKINEKLIASFIKGVFDGDGSAPICYDKKKGYSVRIKISSANKLFTERIRLLLKRIGIASSLFSWKSKGFSNTKMFEAVVSNEFDILTFIKKIGSGRLVNQRKFEWMKNFYLKNKNKGHATFMLAPLICGRLIKEIRKKHNISANKIAPYATYLTNRERCQERTRKDIFKNFYNSLKRKCKDKKLDILEKMISPEFYLDRITQIKEKNPFDKNVYDITASNTHLFIPNGDFVVSNCWIGAFNQEEVKKVLGIPERYKVVVLLPLGFPADKPKPKSRKKLEEIVSYEKF